MPLFRPNAYSSEHRTLLPPISLYTTHYIYQYSMHAICTQTFSRSRSVFIRVRMGKAKKFMGLWKKGRFGIVENIVRKLQLQTSLSQQQKGVKQGHFVVVATQGWKPERFVIELDYLYHPDFVKMLKQAEEEFGFSGWRTCDSL